MNLFTITSLLFSMSADNSKEVTTYIDKGNYLINLSKEKYDQKCTRVKEAAVEANAIIDEYDNFRSMILNHLKDSFEVTLKKFKSFNIDTSNVDENLFISENTFASGLAQNGSGFAAFPSLMISKRIINESKLKEAQEFYEKAQEFSEKVEKEIRKQNKTLVKLERIIEFLPKSMAEIKNLHHKIMMIDATLKAAADKGELEDAETKIFKNLCSIGEELKNTLEMNCIKEVNGYFELDENFIEAMEKLAKTGKDLVVR